MGVAAAVPRLPAPPDRIAVIADIHGNADALAAVLQDLGSQGAGLVVNLGDHFSGPLAAGETASLLLAQPDMVSIRGNHDRYLLQTPLASMSHSDATARRHLGPDAMAWLSALPATAMLGADVALCHGTPADDETYLMQHVTGQGAIAARDGQAVAELVAGVTAPLILCAHSHLPGHLRLADGRQVVNPGSVGCPAYHDDEPVPHAVETGTPEASYALLDRQPGGWKVTFRPVAYDTCRMVARALAEGREDWARAVATGRVTG